MHRKTIHGIDPYAPGGITALLEHHRLTFGDAVMEDGGEAGTAGSEGTAGAGEGAGTAADAGSAGAGTGTAGEGQQAQSVDQLPDWAQKLIADTRKEAGDYRAAAKTASDTATQSLTEKLATALGLKPDAAADPAALTQQLTAEREAKVNAARELAIYKAAGQHGADPAKLLDSNAFMTSVKGLDPADGDAVANAIKAAVTANQALKAARAAGASGVEQTGGTGEQGQVTEEQLARMTPEQINDALEKGLLKNLL